MAGPTSFWAPVHRVLARVATGGSGFPLNYAPNLDFLGHGIQDHRLPYNLFNSPTAAAAFGIYACSDIMTMNAVPAAAATNNIAAAANPTSGTPMTLVSSSGSGIVVLTTAAPALILPGCLVNGTGAITAGLAIDAIPTYSRFGSAGTFTTVFPLRSTCFGRCVSVTGVSGGSGGTVTIKGYDTYGYAMSQTVTVAAGANTVNTTKAFKIVTSVTPNFTDTHTLAVGTADIFGFGLLAQFFGDVRVVWNNALITANTGFTAADQTIPATATTGDVRGTYAVQSASDGTKRLQISVTPSLGIMATNPTTALWGQPQV